MLKKINVLQLGRGWVEGCAWDPSSLESEVGGWRVLGQPELKHQVPESRCESNA